MKKENLYEAIGDINENYVNDAHMTAKKKSRSVWVKWVAMAACLCLVVIGAFSIMPNSNHSTHKAPTVLFNDAEYYICGSRGEAIILKDCGLPTELSSDLAGGFITYLKYDGECYYTATREETNFVMYEYKLEPNTNVYIVLIDEVYYAAVRFGGDIFYGIGDNSYKPE